MSTKLVGLIESEFLVKIALEIDSLFFKIWIGLVCVGVFRNNALA